MYKGVYKIWLAIATLIVLAHNLTPHHHHLTPSSVLGQWQDNDHHDGFDEQLASLQLDHVFPAENAFSDAGCWDMVLNELYPGIKAAQTPVLTSYSEFDDCPPDRRTVFLLSFRGPPADLVS